MYISPDKSTHCFIPKIKTTQRNISYKIYVYISKLIVYVPSILPKLLRFLRLIISNFIDATVLLTVLENFEPENVALVVVERLYKYVKAY